MDRPISAGTSTSGPITAANAAPLWIPKLAIATAMASSELFDAAVNDRVAACDLSRRRAVFERRSHCARACATPIHVIGAIASSAAARPPNTTAVLV
jgi:hypothetical protein